MNGKQRLGFVAIALAIVVLLGGCATPALKAARDFKAAGDSGADSDRVFLAIVPPPSGGSDSSLLAALSAVPDLRTALVAAGCKPPAPQVQPAVVQAFVPLLAAMAQFGFESWIENQKAEVEAILEAAKASYSATIDVNDAAFIGSSPCLAVMRYGIEKDTLVPGMSAVLKLRLAGGTSAGIQALQVEPTYVRFFNSVAVTASVADPKVPTIDVAFGVTVKAVGNQRSGLPALLPAGAGTVQLAKVEIGKAAKDACQVLPERPLAGQRICPRSELIPYPVGKGPLVVSVGVAETGKTGIPGARALAELEALKAAFGPALSEAVKAHFDQ
jgi:hypothetical protein